jgi:glycosyltransferase involved in cell wall biosynthesis
MSACWLLIAGDFAPHGGMDMANFALANYLARPQGGAGGEGDVRNGREVHLVSHHVSPALAALSTVRVHTAPRPFGAERLGEPILRLSARRWQQRLASRGVRTIANGGNADAGDLNWVHFVHSAFRPEAAGVWNRARVASSHRRYLAHERTALQHARAIICNSNRTADAVVQLTDVPRDRTNVVYYGTDAQRFGPVDPAERESARRALGVRSGRPLALFVGALGDRRKGFDTLFEAWRALCREPDWDVDLLVAGTGAELMSWRARAVEHLPAGRMQFLGFRRDVPALLAASDVLVHPARYEAYGLSVHEALCRGLPAIVSATAGIAERYPEDLRQLLLADPESVTELIGRLRQWRTDTTLRERVLPFTSRLRSRTWDHMAREIAAIASRAA